MGKNSVLIIGSIALDTIETPAGGRDNVIGGSTTYAMVAASRVAPVSIVGIVGSDFPDEGWELYRQYGADLTDLQTVVGSTFRWGGRYHQNWDDRDTIFTNLGVFENFTPRLHPDNRQHSHVLLANIHPSIQLSIIDQTSRSEMVVVDTMNLWIETELSSLKVVLSRSQVLLINETEAMMLAGSKSISDSVPELLDMGPDIVVVKRGSQGALAFRGDTTIEIGSYPVEKVIDPTGAGDSFGGGFTAALANGEPLEEALVEGSALASLCVEGFGTESLIASEAAEVEGRKDFLRQTLKS
ncbi:MAG: PfkB family carbohydrate kinase [Fidelibacterota bacterium]